MQKSYKLPWSLFVITTSAVFMLVVSTQVDFVEAASMWESDWENMLKIEEADVPENDKVITTQIYQNKVNIIENDKDGVIEITQIMVVNNFEEIEEIPPPVMLQCMINEETFGTNLHLLLEPKALEILNKIRNGMLLTEEESDYFQSEMRPLERPPYNDVKCIVQK